MPLKNDLLGPAGQQEFVIISTPPLKKKDYLTLGYCFDPYVWAFTLASLGAVTIALIIIDKIATLSNRPSKDTNKMTGGSNVIRLIKQN